ncbi:MAG: hypothetical protein QXZ25_01425 [Candidatus Bathyarchaeia archaeon]
MTKNAHAKVEKQEFAPLDLKCPHSFGYLSQRRKGEKIPDECITCEKLLDCMLSEVKGEAPTPKPKSEIPEPTTTKEAIKEAEKPMEEAAEQIKMEEMEEISKPEIEEIVKPKLKAEQPPAEPPKDQFTVDNLGMLYASWSSTVRIHREILSNWGRKIKEVEIETASKKRTRCKVQPMDEDSRKRVIEVPDKIQFALGIKKGDTVKVKPIT